MTDKQKLIDLLSEFGVEFTDTKSIIRCSEGDKGVGGYPNYEIDFSFDAKGNFIEVGAFS